MLGSNITNCWIDVDQSDCVISVTGIIIVLASFREKFQDVSEINGVGQDMTNKMKKFHIKARIK